jgi:acetolactate synthase I/II/III large subunit
MDDYSSDLLESEAPELTPEEQRKAQLAAKAPVLTGSGAIFESLELLGIKDVFGLPGGAIMPFYDELMSADKIRHILVRHEQGAGHAAEGYAAASGKLGVALRRRGLEQPTW